MYLSIITICFNNRDGLERTIKSVISQTWRDFEWIVIDGGSTDGSKELIEHYQDQFSYWCSEPDKGIYNAMNKGIEHAKGEYLQFLNSGDILYNEKVLEEVFSLRLTDDIVSGNAVRMDNNAMVRENIENLHWQILFGTIDHQAAFIKRALFDEIRYDESLKIVSDWKFWVETIVLRNVSVKRINVLVCKQDMTGISFDEKNNQLQIEERERVLRSFFSPAIYDGIMDYFILYFNSIVQNMM